MLALMLAGALAAAAPGGDEAPWDAAPFAAAPAEVARWAAGHPADPAAELEVLLEEGRFAFDAEGRMTYAYRLVYRPVSRSAVEQGASLARAWHPWHEERPQLRARTVHPDGGVQELDPATVSEAGSTEGADASRYSDTRLLRAPVPGVRAGDVVEIETLSREQAPFFEAGRTFRFWLGGRVAVRRTRVRVEAPPALPLRWQVLGGAAQRPAERRADGLRVLEWDLRDLPAQRALSPLAAPDVQQPSVVLATGDSWRAVAARYAARVEERLAGADLAAVARELDQGPPGAVAVAQRALDWISARVRYTALELGEASIIPVRPQEALARGYGDCKDLSTLLVALLRAAGIKAELALLRTGRDDPADLPGLGEFDHVIVHVPGKPALWIDPTDPDTPVGELPGADQGRLALVAAPGVAGLERTPLAGADVNRWESEREIQLAEAGLARALLTDTARGPFAAGERRAARWTSAEALRKRDGEDAERIAPGAALESVEREGIADRAGPVRVRLALSGTRWGTTGSDDAEASCPAAGVLEQLPPSLRPAVAAARPAEEPPPSDLQLRAVALETRCVVVPPPGFQPEPLPAPRRVASGPLQLELAAELLPGGRVLVRERLALAGGRVPAAVAQELVRAVRGVDRGDLRIRFRRISAVLLELGKGREALDEIRRLGALHPGEARHQAHLALALLRLGLGDAARAAARKASEMEPENGWARRVAATALASDPLGRWLMPGCDVDGAVAAQREALAREAPNADYRSQLATLLEAGSDGARFAPGARLDEALALRRAVRSELGDRTHDEDLLELLVRMGRGPEAIALAREMKPGPRQRASLLAALALAGDLDGALAEAARIPVEERAVPLDEAATALVAIRQYAAASALLTRGGPGSTRAGELGARGAVLSRVRPVALEGIDPSSPRSLAARVVRLAMARGQQARAAAVQDVLAEEVRTREVSEAVIAELAGTVGALRAVARGMSEQTLVDLVSATADLSVDGDEEVGYRLVFTNPTSSRKQVLFAVREGRVLRMIANGDAPGTLARRTRRLLAAGKVDAARRQLGWVRDLTGKGQADPWAAEVVAALLRGGDRAPAQLAVAAAALGAFGVGGAEYLEELRDARREAAGEEARFALDAAMDAIYVDRGDWEGLRALGAEGASGANMGFSRQVRALRELRRAAELRELGAQRLARLPGDRLAVRALRAAAVLEGNAAEARRLAMRAAAGEKPELDDQLEAVRAALFVAPLPEEALAEARRAVELSQRGSYPALALLAVVHAARGEAGEAMQALGQAMARKPSGQAGPLEHLVLGRVAQLYGLQAEAIASWERIDRRSTEVPFDVAAVAARWRAGR